MTDSLKRLDPLPSYVTDRQYSGEPSWFVSVWHFGGRSAAIIATFPEASEADALAFYRKTVEGDVEGRLKEVLLGQSQAMVDKDGKPAGRASVISLATSRTRRKSAWREGLYWAT